MTAPDDPAAASPSPPPTVGPPPRPVSAADREAFDALVKDSFSSVRAMAAGWRTGLTALITLVTTGIVITGRTAATTLTVPWRTAVTLAIGGGLALAILGLWHVLAVEVGARVRMRTLDEIRVGYASVQAYLVGQAAIAARRLQAARAVVGGALALLVIGVLLTWWAPAAPATPPAYLRVALRGGTVCGTLRSADGGVLRLAVAGAARPAAIPLASVTNLAVVAGCP